MILVKQMNISYGLCQKIGMRCIENSRIQLPGTLKFKIAVIGFGFWLQVLFSSIFK